MVGVTGDMVLRGADDADWQRFFAVTQPLLAQVRYLPAIGNHDLGWTGAGPGSESDAVFALPPGPPGRPAGTVLVQRRARRPPPRVPRLQRLRPPEQERWLEADLAAARAREVRAIIVFTHDGPFSRGYHGGNLDRARPATCRSSRAIASTSLRRRPRPPLPARRDRRAPLRRQRRRRRVAVRDRLRRSPASPRCAVDDGMRAVSREHHYLVLTISRTTLELCARRGDGRLLENCTRYPLQRG